MDLDETNDLLRSVVDLLTDIKAALENQSEEVETLRREFEEFSGHNTYKMEAVVNDVTGPMGYHLGDLYSKLDEVISAIGSLETSIEFK